MKIVIVGAGRVGYAIAEQLLTEGHDITVVESDPERAAYISSTLDVIVVEGRANVDQLRIANVADADLLIAATTSDETNLIISSFAHHEKVPKIVTKVDEDNFIQLAESYGLTTIIQPADVTAGRIVEYGTLEDVFEHTLHPYTEGPFNSLPNINDRRHQLTPIPGLMPDPSKLPEGCAFAPRCRYATDA